LQARVNALGRITPNRVGVYAPSRHIPTLMPALVQHSRYGGPDPPTAPLPVPALHLIQPTSYRARAACRTHDPTPAGACQRGMLSAEPVHPWDYQSELSWAPWRLVRLTRLPAHSGLFPHGTNLRSMLGLPTTLASSGRPACRACCLVRAAAAVSDSMATMRRGHCGDLLQSSTMQPPGWSTSLTQNQA